MKVLREFGLGIVWFLLVPLILLASALVAVYGVFNFFIQFVIMLINFFKGEKLFPLFPEEKKAMAIYQRAIDKANGEKEEEKPVAPQTVYVQQNFYSGAPAIPPAPPIQGLPNNPYYAQPGMPMGNLPNGYAPQGQIPYPNPAPAANQIPAPAEPSPLPRLEEAKVIEAEPLELAQFPSDKETKQ